MPMQLLGVSVPGYLNRDIEVCHSFTVNFIQQRQYQRSGVYNPDYNYQPVSSYLLGLINDWQYRLQLMPIGTPINAGDIILLISGDDGRDEVLPNRLVHSMVAINGDIWCGCNNIGTFGRSLELQGTPLAQIQSIANRGVIDLSRIFTNRAPMLDINGYTLHRPNSDNYTIRIVR